MVTGFLYNRSDSPIKMMESLTNGWILLNGYSHRVAYFGHGLNTTDTMKISLAPLRERRFTNNKRGSASRPRFISLVRVTRFLIGHC